MIYDVAVQPAGSHIVAAVGHRVLVYDTESGELIKGLKGHKGQVYCVAYARDSSRFASGSADKHVIIWTAALQGILRYKHHDAIYSLAYNPVSLQLLSCSDADFGLWSPEKNSVEKKKVSSRIVSSAWSPDGQVLALGFYDGSLSLRSKDGNELVSISRGEDPVWALAWRPSLSSSPVLAVGDWTQTLSFYSATGRKLGREISLGFDPTSLSFWNGPEEYILIGGSNSALGLYTKEGVFVKELVSRSGWVWAGVHQAGTHQIALGTSDGSVSLHEVIFDTVHALHGQHYALRTSMTSVLITDLITEEKTTVPVRAPISKLALYNNRLAVQVPDGIAVFELYAGATSGMATSTQALLNPVIRTDNNPVARNYTAGDNGDGHDDNDDDGADDDMLGGMLYRKLAHIPVVTPVSLLTATSSHVVLTSGATLTLVSLSGERVRDWTLSSTVRYVKSVGGPAGGENLLVGLKSGRVVKIFINSPFPVTLVEVGASIRSLDLSASRSRLAVVDEHFNLMVYDLDSNELLYTEREANSAAFNAQHEDLVAFSTTNDTVKLKASTHPAVERELPGFVIGFTGSRVFALEENSMKAREIPMDKVLSQYLSDKDFDRAYKVACLGVTEADWRRLALDALTALRLGIARKAFTRIRELRYIELVDTIERAAAAPGADDSVLLASILAFQGKIPQAAKMYERANKPQLALDMYVDLGLLEEAEAIAAKYAIPMEQLMKKREASVVDSGDWRALVELYHSSGQHDKVVATLREALEEDVASAGDGGPASGDKLELLAQVVEGLSAQEKSALRDAAKVLMAHEQYAAALVAYSKLGDIKTLVSLHVKLEQWDDAFSVVKDYPAYVQDVYVPYSDWLLEKDDFEGAVQALDKSGARDKSVQLLEALISNSVSEARFGDAASYYWWLASVYLSEVTVPVEKLTSGDKKKLKRFSVYVYKSELYYAFQFVRAYIDEPFNPHLGSVDAVFNITRYLLTRIDRVAPRGVSKVYTLIALARLGLDCGAYNLARSTLDKLSSLVVPNKWLYELDAMAIATRARLTDAPTLRDMYPRCARCGAVNALIPRAGACSSCYHEFQLSFYSFDTLPLVEFVLPDSISTDIAFELLESDSMTKMGSSGAAAAAAAASGGGPSVPTFVLPSSSSSGRTWRESSGGGAETLTLTGGSSSGGGGGGSTSGAPALIEELFGEQMVKVTSSEQYVPLVISRKGLSRLNPSQVLTKVWPCPAMRTQFWINLTPALPVYGCTKCNHFFHEEDYELHVLMDGSPCPVCGEPFIDNGALQQQP